VERLIFSDVVQVNIQGARVLRFLECYENYVEYEIIGFRGSVVLRDYRQIGLNAIHSVLTTGSITQFATKFNNQAYATLYEPSDGLSLLIELRDSDESTVPHQLWIAIGLKPEIPVLDYELGFIMQIDEDSYALIALFLLEQPVARHSENYSSSSSSASTGWVMSPVSPSLVSPLL
jgi:hypothetical protein